MSINLPRLLASNFARYGGPIGVKACTLIKVTDGIRRPDSVTGGTHPTELSYAAQGLRVSRSEFTIANSLITDTDIAILLFAASIEAGAVPLPNDRIVFDGVTYTIAGETGAVKHDPASATFTCTCR